MGGGNFTPGPTTQTAPDAECIAVGDVNNDGKLDLVVAGANGTNILPGNGRVEVNNSADFALFTGKSDGTFNPVGSKRRTNLL